MSELPELPPRPEPPRRIADAVRAQLAWFGVGRLALGAGSMIVVIAGAFWLLRSPTPSAETTLPVAGGASAPAPPTPTLPAPTAPATVAVSVVATLPPSIVVHVAGAVAVPGVYEVRGTDRVAAAVAAAGGPAGDGDLDSLNLAAPLADGQRIYVPRLGEIDPATVPSGGASAAVALPADGTAGTSPPSGPIDLNSATAAELDALPGVGPATATAIVDDRTRNGPFASVDDLDRVPGIGPAKLEAVRDLVKV